MAKLRFELTHQRGEFVLNAAATLPEAGVTMLFGPSGSGKSTLLMALAGLLHGEGVVAHGDQCWQASARRCFVPPHRRPLSVVFQDGRLFEHMSVEENLRFAWQHGHGATPIAWDVVVDGLGIAPWLKRRPQQLSGGQRQRVALARGLLVRPAWLFLDEPLSALDAPARSEILALLEGLKADLELPMLWVTHSIEEVERLGDQVVFMDSGQLQPPQSLQAAIRQPGTPLFREEAPVALLTGTVSVPCDGYGLSQLQLGESRLFAHAVTAPIGTNVRLRVPAASVTLSRAPLEETSALNQLPAQVMSLGEVQGHQQLVTLALADGQTLLAQVTRRSLQMLDLQPGEQIWAVIKAVSVL
ncbi:molybdate transport system ATP-binding protein [Sulfurivirga caldicuralii]|uniref:Molybdate transport system ATP-binding protein n=1 Tax=Sulfurivirga caldicuralii TaxID=364032 RepID=A0A1N6DU07_9GAMM|nr:molybdenum ABC transporter ATP-binding protein [Sulfurivirga caldicuralii]SIN74288.1 molybdate transport system ATP-binding protein [Sulfurivirga caldicuralii]